MSDERDLIRARVSIVDLVGERVNLKKMGRAWKGLCPFHDDKNPSFQVSEDSGTYRCWSCGAKGDVFSWVMHFDKLEFREALELLAERAGIKLQKANPQEVSKRKLYQSANDEALRFFQEMLKEDKTAREYCEKRGLSEAVCATFELGYAPAGGMALAGWLKKAGINLGDAKEIFLVEGDDRSGYGDKFKDRLMFPIRDERGHLVAFGGRVLYTGQPKYINSSDTPLYSKRRVLYGMDQAREAIAKADRAILVEGYLDVIACHRAGLTNAIASLGTSLSNEHAKLMRRWCKNVTVLYDSDSAGQTAAARAAEILVQEGLTVKVALLPPGQDPDSLLKEIGAEAVVRVSEGGMAPIEYELDQLKKQISPELPEFWDKAIPLLSRTKNHLEFETYLRMLSGIYPGFRDPLAAYQALRREAQRILKKDAPAEVAPPPPQKTYQKQYNKNWKPAPPPVRLETVVRQMRGPEKMIFLALLEEELRKDAWEVIEDDGIFQSDFARKLQEQLLAKFPEGLSLPTSQWIPQIEDPACQGYLADLVMNLQRAVDKPGFADSESLAEAKRILEGLRDDTRRRQHMLKNSKTEEDILTYDRRVKEKHNLEGK